MSPTTLLWGILIFGFAAFLGGFPAAVMLFVGAFVLVTVIVGIAALFGWLARRSKPPSPRP